MTSTDYLVWQCSMIVISLYVVAFFFHFFCVKVETFGSMEREEKVKFILEQMRLCMAKKDFIRTQIISKKISTKFFADTSDIVQVHQHTSNILE